MHKQNLNHDKLFSINGITSSFNMLNLHTFLIWKTLLHDPVYLFAVENMLRAIKSVYNFYCGNK